MNKKKAYELAMYLLDEAYGVLNYDDYFTDIQAITNLLGATSYIVKSYNLKEIDLIEERIQGIKHDTFDYIEKVKETLRLIN